MGNENNKTPEENIQNIYYNNNYQKNEITYSQNYQNNINKALSNPPVINQNRIPNNINNLNQNINQFNINLNNQIYRSKTFNQ